MLRFRCLTEDHHPLWSKCCQKGCVACTWVDKHAAANLLLNKGGCMAQVCGSKKFQGVSNLKEVYIMQPLLLNTTGGASSLLGVIGRTVPTAYRHEV